MATSIDWADIVGAGTIADGGKVGDLLNVARAHIDDAVATNRLTQAQAGEVYTALIPAAISGGIEFVMKEQLVSKQTDKEIMGIVTALLGTQLGAWSSAFNGGKIDNIPGMLENADIKDAFDIARGIAGMTGTSSSGTDVN